MTIDDEVVEDTRVAPEVVEEDTMMVTVLLHCGPVGLLPEDTRLEVVALTSILEIKQRLSIQVGN